MKDANDILIERGQVINQMTELSEKHSEGFSAEVQAQYDAMDAKQNELKATADRLVREESLRAEVSGVAPRQPVAADAAVSPRATAEYKAAFNEYLRKPKGAVAGEFLNALQVGTNSEGGFVTHEEFQTSVERAMVNYNAFRQYATVISTGGDRNIPYESTRGAASWTAEEASYPESDPAFGRLTLGAHKLAKIIKVSEELVNDSDFDLFSYLTENAAEAFGIAEENAFLNGTGSGQPNGLLTLAGDVGSAETAITEEALDDLFWGVGAADRTRAVWVFGDVALRDISKLKNSNGDRIWSPGLTAGAPDTILGRPYINSDHMGSPANSPEEVVGYFGDLSKYIIADRTNMVIQRLDERYADTGQVGFRCYRRVDAGAAITSAHKSLTLAAA